MIFGAGALTILHEATPESEHEERAKQFFYSFKNGHRGPIAGYFVSQTIGKDARPEDRKKHLVHEVRWRAGANYPSRSELGSWQAA